METYNAKRDPDATLPPQAALIVKLVRSSRSGLTREQLVEQLKLGVKMGTLKTAQPPARILAFYKPILVKRGWLEVTGESEQKPKAPAPAPKPKADKVTDLCLRLCDCTGKVVEAEATVAKFKVHRVFKVSIKGQADHLLVLAGHDADDHMIWSVADNKAVLVGTLARPAYSDACRAKELCLRLDQFDWTNADVTLPEAVRSALGWTDSARPALRTTNAALPAGEIAGIY